jgi:OOP family OmpA-OmpF porin
MTKKQFDLGKIALFAAPIGLAAGLALLPQESTAANKYTMGPGGTPVMSGAGLCWQSPGGKDILLEECGDVIVEPVAAPMDSDGDGVPDDRDECPGTPPGVSVDSVGCPLDSDGDGVPDHKDKCPGTRAGAKVDSQGCEIIEDITIDLDVGVEEFDFDSADLRPEMKVALDDVAEKVKASKGDETLTIVGHTDSTGPAEYNMGLSVRRAQSAADYLVSMGIAAERISVSGEGEENPIADNATREGRAKNRRVEIRTE